MSHQYSCKSWTFIIPWFPLAAAVTVSLSVMNNGMVSEANGAMLVQVNLIGELERAITVQVETCEGTGVLTVVFIRCVLRDPCSIFSKRRR